MTYELYGKVSVLDKNDDIINKNVEVFIGGYKTFIGASKEFNLKFVSPETSEVFIVIRYEVDEEKFEFTRGLVIEDNNYIIKEEFTIHV